MALGIEPTNLYNHQWTDTGQVVQDVHSQGMPAYISLLHAIGYVIVRHFLNEERYEQQSTWN